MDNVFSDNEILDNLDSATQEELKRYFKGEIEKLLEMGISLNGKCLQSNRRNS